MRAKAPKRLRAGDEVRIVAPSRSLGLMSQETKQTALERLQNDFGLKVTFSKCCDEMDAFASSSISSRVSDLHDAFVDKSVKAVLLS